MEPTIENWSTNPIEIGPLYPWLGLEIWMVIVATLFCLFFLAWKIKSESRHYDQMEQQLAAGIPDAEARQHEELSNG